jgi:hypothetical protein
MLASCSACHCSMMRSAMKDRSNTASGEAPLASEHSLTRTLCPLPFDLCWHSFLLSFWLPSYYRMHMFVAAVLHRPQACAAAAPRPRPLLLPGLADAQYCVIRAMNDSSNTANSHALLAGTCCCLKTRHTPILPASNPYCRPPHQTVWHLNLCVPPVCILCCIAARRVPLPHHDHARFSFLALLMHSAMYQCHA